MPKFILLLGVSALCGLLGAVGGAHKISKSWRRIAIPGIFTVVGLVYLRSLWCLGLMALMAVFSLGYGMPWRGDEGSSIGDFWYGKTKDYKKANIATRGTIGILFSLVLLIIPFIKGDWIQYLYSSIGVCCVYTIISWKDIGVFNFLGKNLLKSEFYVYFLLGIFTTILILF